jgi:hypothetical protein
MPAQVRPEASTVAGVGRRYWTTCPGCWLDLPAGGGPADRESGASAECRLLLAEVEAYGRARPALDRRVRGLTRDAYAAQHPGARPPATMLGLIGLHLALDLGRPGDRVRTAQERLAGPAASWPALIAPVHRGDVTVFDVAGAESPTEHEERVRAWAHAVWEAWAPQHDVIAALAERATGQERVRVSG